MPIYKIQKRENPFVQIDKHIFDNPNISWKAKGLLGYLLSKPDDWQVRIEDIKKKAKDGKSACRTGLAELEVNGYINRSMERDQNGSFTQLIYHVFERPIDIDSEKTPLDKDKPKVRKEDHGRKDSKTTTRFMTNRINGTQLSATGKSNPTNIRIYTNKENNDNESSSTNNNEPSLIENIEEVISYWNATFEEEVDLSDKQLMRDIETALQTFSVAELIEAMECRSHAAYYKKFKPEFRDDPSCFFPYPKTIRRDMKRLPVQPPYELIPYEKKVELETAVSGGRNVNVEGDKMGSMRFEMDPVKKDAKGRPLWRYWKS